MTISAGWYPDPAEPGVQRYWDGEGWVGAAIPVDATPPEGPPPAEIAPQTKTEPPMAYGETPGKAERGRSRWGSGGGSNAPDDVAAQQPAPPLPGPYVMPVPVRPLGLPLATPGARLLARLVDTAAVLLLNVLVNGWFVYLLYKDMAPYVRDAMRVQRESTQLFPDLSEVPQPANINALILVIVVLSAALWFAYEVPATANSGQTFGKRLLKIKVVLADRADKPLGFGRSWGRWTTMGLPVLFIPCCPPLFVFLLPVLWFIDALPIAVDTVRRMAVHDRRAQTYVVQLAPERKSS